MALKETMISMNKLLEAITKDMAKADLGNKAASQRVRTGTIKLEKVAKLYRKESIAAEKKGLIKRKPAAKAAPKKAKVVAKKKAKVAPKKAKIVAKKKKK
jgi:hypothetical protein